MAVLRTVRAYLRRSVSLPPFCCFFAFAGRKRGTLLSPSLVFLSASPSPPLAHRTGVSFPARQQELGERFAGWLSVFSQLALAIEKLETFFTGGSRAFDRGFYGARSLSSGTRELGTSSRFRLRDEAKIHVSVGGPRERARLLFQFRKYVGRDLIRSTILGAGYCGLHDSGELVNDTSYSNGRRLSSCFVLRISRVDCHIQIQLR